MAARRTVRLEYARSRGHCGESGVDVARVVVDVMLKPEILDPEGRAIQGALTRLGLDGVSDVRQGKRFEIALEGEIGEERADTLNRLAAELLANPVIEDYQLRVEEGQ